MDKQQIIESIQKTVNQEIEEWVNEESTIKDPIQYESRLLQRALRIGKAMMEQGSGKLARDRNAKKKF